MQPVADQCAGETQVMARPPFRGGRVGCRLRLDVGAHRGWERIQWEDWNRDGCLGVSGSCSVALWGHNLRSRLPVAPSGKRLGCGREVAFVLKNGVDGERRMGALCLEDG